MLFMLGLISRGPPTRAPPPQLPGPASWHCTDPAPQTTLGKTGGPLARPPRLPAPPWPPGEAAAIKSKSNSAWMHLRLPRPFIPSARLPSASPSVFLALRPRHTPPSHQFRTSPCLSRGHSVVTQPGVASLSNYPTPEHAGQISVLHVGREWTGLTDGLPPAHSPRIQRSTSRTTAGPWTLGLDDTHSRTYTSTRIVAQPTARQPNTPTLIPQSPTAQSFLQRPTSQQPYESVQAPSCLSTRPSEPFPRPRGCPGTGPRDPRVHRPFRLGSPSTSPAPRCSLPCLACCETRPHSIPYPQPPASQQPASTKLSRTWSCPSLWLRYWSRWLGLSALWLPPNCKSYPRASRCRLGAQLRPPARRQEMTG